MSFGKRFHSLAAVHLNDVWPILVFVATMFNKVESLKSLVWKAEMDGTRQHSTEATEISWKRYHSLIGKFISM